MNSFTYKHTDPVVPTSVQKQIYWKSRDLPVFCETSLYYKEKSTIFRIWEDLSWNFFIKIQSKTQFQKAV